MTKKIVAIYFDIYFQPWANPFCGKICYNMPDE